MKVNYNLTTEGGTMRYTEWEPTTFHAIGARITVPVVVKVFKLKSGAVMYDLAAPGAGEQGTAF